MNLINLDEYRQQRKADALFAVTFFAATHGDPSGVPRNFTLKVLTQDPQGTIAAAKDFGGVNGVRGDVYHFIPWPPAAIEVRAATKEEAGSPATA